MQQTSEREVAELRGCASADLHGTLLTGPYPGVPNLNAIGPAVLEIWNRHPARAHVQSRSQLTFALLHATLLTGPRRCTKFERNRFSRSRDMGTTLARAHVQYHPNCDT